MRLKPTDIFHSQYICVGTYTPDRTWYSLREKLYISTQRSHLWRASRDLLSAPPRVDYESLICSPRPCCCSTLIPGGNVDIDIDFRQYAGRVWVTVKLWAALDMILLELE